MTGGLKAIYLGRWLSLYAFHLNYGTIDNASTTLHILRGTKR